MFLLFPRDFVRSQRYRTEAEAFGWSFVFQDFVSEEVRDKVTRRIQVMFTSESGFWSHL